MPTTPNSKGGLSEGARREMEKKRRGAHVQGDMAETEAEVAGLTSDQLTAKIREEAAIVGGNGHAGAPPKTVAPPPASPSGDMLADTGPTAAERIRTYREVLVKALGFDVGLGAGENIGTLEITLPSALVKASADSNKLTQMGFTATELESAQEAATSSWIVPADNMNAFVKKLRAEDISRH
jgi:hypothetical protein